MLNLKYLEAFILTADCGSFRKAAEAMFITPSALIKQINLLEEETGVPLFERTPRGLHLTASGRSLYTDGKHLLEEAEHALERARRRNDDLDQVIRVGTSPVSPADTIASVWGNVYAKWPQLKIEIVPFSNSPYAVSRLFRNFGDEIDLICGVTDTVHLHYRRCSGLTIEHLRVNAAVPFHHPLAARESLSLNDFRNQTILLMSEGKMGVMDQIRHHIQTECPDAGILDFDMYDMSVFNRCEETGAILIITEKWLRAHPVLKMISIDWDFTIPYGILYARNPSEKVKRFITSIQS